MPFSTPKIVPVDLSDAPVLARNNMSAFWEDRNWRLVWREGITLDFLIEQVRQRMPNNLLQRRHELRHEKAIDPETGEVLGYARWVLPATHTTNADGTPAWKDAQTPDVTEDERTAIKAASDAAWWDPREDINSGPDTKPIRDRILAERSYLSLDYLAVHPDYQRRGVASALTRSGMKMAEELGLPVFILAFPCGNPVYMRLGFREVARNVEDDRPWGGEGNYVVTFLVYDSKVDGPIKDAALGGK